MWTRQSVAFMVVAGLLLGTAGCPPSSPRGWGVRTVSWGGSGTETVAGLDDVSVVIGNLGERPAIIIWSDGGGSFGANWDRQRKAVHFAGSLRMQSGLHYPVEGFTPDGHTGSMTIGDQTFDLQQGAFFLVDTSSGEIHVRQLDRALPDLPPDDASSDSFVKVFKDLAQQDPEIREFYRQSKSTGAAEGDSPEAEERVGQGE